MAELLVVDVSITPNAQYNVSKGRNCGITQLILGVLSIACGYSAIVGRSGLAIIGYSIWGGAIVGCMVISIVSAVCALGQLPWEAFCALYHRYAASNCYEIYDCPSYPVAFHSIASVIGLIELFPSIIAAVNCCRGASCCCGCCIECIGKPMGELPPRVTHSVSAGPATNSDNTLIATSSNTHVAMTSTQHELPPYSEHDPQMGAVNHIEDHGQEYKKV